MRSLHKCSRMNTNKTSPALEIVTLPIGNGWRVRISDGQRMQFVAGFEAQSKAEEWARNSARTWLDKLKTLPERL